MANYAGGRIWEYALRDWYVKKGYAVTRSAGSRGAADLVAVNHKEVVFIQCKKELKKKTYLDDLKQLRELPRAWFIRKELWVKKGQKVDVYNEFGEKIGTTSLKELKSDEQIK